MILLYFVAMLIAVVVYALSVKLSTKTRTIAALLTFVILVGFVTIARLAIGDKPGPDAVTVRTLNRS